MYKTAVYRLVNGNIQELTYRMQQGIKGDIIQQHIDTQSMWFGQYHLFMIFAVFDV